MFKKMFTIGILLVVAIATVLVTPDTVQAQRYVAGYGVYQPYFSPYFGYYRPYYGNPYFNRPHYGGYYYSYPGYYGVYPRYGYNPNYYLWR